MESLPLELIQSIGGFLAPEAIDPFTSTSKHIRRVLTRLIDEHQSLKRDFEHAICGENQPLGSIVDLLLNVLTRPHLHYYVRKLTIEDWPNDPPSETERVLRIRSNSKIQMRQSLHDGYASLSSAVATLKIEDGVFPLLLLELSELRVLRLVGEPSDESMIYDMLWEIQDDSSSSVRLFPGFLQNLRELQLDTNREAQEWGLGIGTAKVFANLSPSLKRISVNGINDDFPDGWPVQLLAKPSNVEHLELNSCAVTDKLLHRFLHGFPKLKTFTMNDKHARYLYEGSWGRRSSPMRIDCYWLCVSLQLHCKDSLQALRLNVPPSSSNLANFLGDISVFRNLRYLELYSEGLIRPEDADEAVLPSSIEELRVNCGNDFEDFEDMCRESQSLASKRKYPNLKQITVECHVVQIGSTQSETLESEQRLQAFGVDFAFLKWSSTRP